MIFPLLGSFVKRSFHIPTLKRRGEFAANTATKKQEFVTIIDIYKFI